MLGNPFTIFPYLKTKVHALLSYSPTEQQVKSMILANSLDELRSILTPTFASSATKLLNEEKNPLFYFESALRQSFGEMLKKMVNISSGSMLSKLSAYENKLTGNNLKRIYKAIILDQDRQQIIPSLVPTSLHSMDELKEIVQFERPDILLDYVPDIDLRKSLINVINEPISDAEKIFKIDNIIDKQVYMELYKEDQDVFNEIEFMNILITCRLINLNFSPSSYLIPVQSPLLRALERTSNLKSSNEVLNYISNISPHFSPFINKALREDPKNPLRYFDISYRRHLIKLDRSFFATNYSDNRVIIKFLNMRWTEINDIVRIAIGKMNDIPPNIISKSLITYHRYT